MSKAFVIKNKEGKYKSPDDGIQLETYFHNTLSSAEIFDDYETALCDCPSNCEVVEITIAEGDFEQQLDKAERELAFYQDEIKNRGTCGLCEKLENKQIKKLEQQLAVLERALKNTCWLLYGTYDEHYTNYFIKQAKKELKGEQQ